METDLINSGRRQLLLGRFGRLKKASQPVAPATALVASISSACLSQQAIVCFTCKEICPTEAISLPPRLGQTANPTVNSTLCTACGECVAACPTAAITLEPVSKEITHGPSGST